MDSDEPQQSAVGESAGQQLKRAREKHNLSLTDIADAQHLRVSIIQAIEDGDYDQIDSELFLKGYVRAYARQVGADADALIQSLDLELKPLREEREKQEQEDPLVNIERRRRKKRRLAKGFFIILVLGAIALAVWKLVVEPRMAGSLPSAPDQSENTGSPDADEPDTGSDSLASSESDLEPEQNLTLSESPEPAESTELSDATEQLDEPEAVSTTDSVSSPELEVSAEAEISAEQEYNPEPESNSEPVNELTQTTDASGNTGSNDLATIEPITAEPSAQPDPVFEESAQPDAVAAPVRLEMSFVSDCWVQVTDASGARLVASLQRDGDQVSVSGRAPLNVVIGAVDAVDTVSFAGEPVNLSDFRVFNNRTEFTLTL